MSGATPFVDDSPAVSQPNSPQYFTGVCPAARRTRCQCNILVIEIHVFEQAHVAMHSTGIIGRLIATRTFYGLNYHGNLYSCSYKPVPGLSSFIHQRRCTFHCRRSLYINFVNHLSCPSPSVESNN